MIKLTTFQIFWLGINAERRARNLPEVLFGEARLMWAQTQEGMV